VKWLILLLVIIGLIYLYSDFNTIKEDDVIHVHKDSANIIPYDGIKHISISEIDELNMKYDIIIDGELLNDKDGFNFIINSLYSNRRVIILETGINKLQTLMKLNLIDSDEVTKYGAELENEHINNYPIPRIGILIYKGYDSIGESMFVAMGINHYSSDMKEIYATCKEILYRNRIEHAPVK
jgi:hypothetical protein